MGVSDTGWTWVSRGQSRYPTICVQPETARMGELLRICGPGESSNC